VALTNILVEKAKPEGKTYRLTDERGLYLEVTPAGGKWWRLRYWFRTKENRLSLGTFPEVSLKEARRRRDEARQLLSNGIDPAAVRKGEKEALADTFEAVAREWHGKYLPTWTPGHAATIMARLEANVFPWIGAKALREIGAPEVLSLLRRIEARGALETAHRVRGIVGQVFRYGVATGRADRDPTGDLRGALPPTEEKHHPTLTDPKAITDLLRALDGYQGSHVTRCALRLAPLVFVRPGELRQAEWPEVDLEAEEWRIPPERMKLRRLHIVPLSRQAVAIFRDLHPLTGSGRLVFPGLRSPARPMSENTVNAALRRLGYAKDEMTGHGFRSMASTILNEQGWTPDAIERQLAHVEKSSVRAAYNYAEHLPERRRMMQAWADYLDALKAGAKVTPIHRAKA
jgi:integrase